MAYDSFYFISLVDSTSPIEIYPTFDFTENIRQSKIDNYTIGGNLNTYKLIGESWEYTVPMTFVSSDNRREFNEWWRDSEEFAFTFCYSSNPETVLCRIVNRDQPFSKHSNLQYLKFDGVVFLRSTRETTEGTTGAFYVDDPLNGLLDQNYNPLADVNFLQSRPSTLTKLSGTPFILDHPTSGKIQNTNFLM